jgi:hypothetical protein
LFNEVGIAAILSATPTIFVIASGSVGVLGIIAIGAANAVPVTVAVQRAFRLSIEASHERVIVTNYWRTYRFEWSEVRAVEIAAEAMGFIAAPAFLFILRSGKYVAAQATPQKKAPQRTALQALAKLAPEGVSFPPLTTTHADDP